MSRCIVCSKNADGRRFCSPRHYLDHDKPKAKLTVNTVAAERGYVELDGKVWDQMKADMKNGISPEQMRNKQGVQHPTGRTIYPDWRRRGKV